MTFIAVRDLILAISFLALAWAAARFAIMQFGRRNSYLSLSGTLALLGVSILGISIALTDNSVWGSQDPHAKILRARYAAQD